MLTGQTVAQHLRVDVDLPCCQRQLCTVEVCLFRCTHHPRCRGSRLIQFDFSSCLCRYSQSFTTLTLGVARQNQFVPPNLFRFPVRCVVSGVPSTPRVCRSLTPPWSKLVRARPSPRVHSCHVDDHPCVSPQVRPPSTSPARWPDSPVCSEERVPPTPRVLLRFLNLLLILSPRPEPLPGTNGRSARASGGSPPCGLHRSSARRSYSLLLLRSLEGQLAIPAPASHSTSMTHNLVHSELEAASGIVLLLELDLLVLPSTLPLLHDPNPPPCLHPHSNVDPLLFSSDRDESMLGRVMVRRRWSALGARAHPLLPRTHLRLRSVLGMACPRFEPLLHEIHPVASHDVMSRIRRDLLVLFVRRKGLGTRPELTFPPGPLSVDVSLYPQSTSQPSRPVRFRARPRPVPLSQAAVAPPFPADGPRWPPPRPPSSPSPTDPAPSEFVPTCIQPNDWSVIAWIIVSTSPGGPVQRAQARVRDLYRGAGPRPKMIPAAVVPLLSPCSHTPPSSTTLERAQ